MFALCTVVCVLVVCLQPLKAQDWHGHRDRYGDRDWYQRRNQDQYNWDPEWRKRHDKEKLCKAQDSSTGEVLINRPCYLQDQTCEQQTPVMGRCGSRDNLFLYFCQEKHHSAIRAACAITRVKSRGEAVEWTNDQKTRSSECDLDHPYFVSINADFADALAAANPFETDDHYHSWRHRSMANLNGNKEDYRTCCARRDLRPEEMPVNDGQDGNDVDGNDGQDGNDGGVGDGQDGNNNGDDRTVVNPELDGRTSDGNGDTDAGTERVEGGTVERLVRPECRDTWPDWCREKSPEDWLCDDYPNHCCVTCRNKLS